MQYIITVFFIKRKQISKCATGYIWPICTEIKFVLLIFVQTTNTRGHDSSIGIALGYGLDNRGSRVRFSAGDANFFLHLRVKICSGAHSASYPMGTGGSFSGGKGVAA
jgi:hypothetical protein